MRRGLPFSLIIHAIFLVGTFVYGAHVNPPRVEPRNVIRVRLTEAPPQQTSPEVLPEIVPEEPPPLPVQEKPTPEEPKQVPEKLPEQKKVEPETKIEAPSPDDQESEMEAEADALILPEGPTASSTDEPFPFAYYLNLVEGRISRHWQPRQLGFRESSEKSCVVHFFIERGGAVTRVTMVQSSGVSLFDREALRAVQAAHPLPPLPTKFAARSLGITFVFTLRSGL